MPRPPVVITAARIVGTGDKQKITQRTGAPSEFLSVREHVFARRNHARRRSRSGARPMTFISSVSGRACLNDWDHTLTVCHIPNLLLSLEHAVPASGARS